MSTIIINATIKSDALLHRGFLPLLIRVQEPHAYGGPYASARCRCLPPPVVSYTPPAGISIPKLSGRRRTLQMARYGDAEIAGAMLTAPSVPANSAPLPRRHDKSAVDGGR